MDAIDALEARITRFWTQSPDEAQNRRRLIFVLIGGCAAAIGWELFIKDAQYVVLINNFLSTAVWLTGIYVGGSVAARLSAPTFQTAIKLDDVPKVAPQLAIPAPADTAADNSTPEADETTGKASQISYTQAATPGHSTELREIDNYKGALQAASDATGIDVYLICGLVSRESAWGLTLKPKGAAGTGDWARRNPAKWHCLMPPDGKGWGRGLMQIDYQQEFAKSGAWDDPGKNLMYGSKELASHIAYFTANFDADTVDPLRAGIAAYNCGRANVTAAISDGSDLDTYTTGHDYSSDIIKRKDWFRDSFTRSLTA